jgi:hypothetical protein
MEETWEGCIDVCDTLREMFPVVLQSSTSSTDPLKQIRTKFSDAVHGYITLLNIDWADLFRCRCIFEDDSKGTIVYDNACNLVVFIQNREPSFFKNYSLQCDNFHHEHGGSGKGHRKQSTQHFPLQQEEKGWHYNKSEQKGEKVANRCSCCADGCKFLVVSTSPRCA